jgi:hypothetical protein
VGRVAQSVECLATGWMARVRTLTEAEDFSSSLCIQTGSGAQPASCKMGTRLRHAANHSHPSSAVVWKERGYTSSPPMRQNWHEMGDLYLYFIVASKCYKYLNLISQWSLLYMVHTCSMPHFCNVMYSAHTMTSWSYTSIEETINSFSCCFHKDEDKTVLKTQLKQLSNNVT